MKVYINSYNKKRVLECFVFYFPSNTLTTQSKWFSNYKDVYYSGNRIDMQVTKRFWKACTILAPFRDDNDYSRISLVQLSPQSHWRRDNARNVSFFYSLRWSIYVFNSVINTKLPTILSHRRSTTVSLETHPHPPPPHSDFASFCLSVCLSVSSLRNYSQLI